MVGLEIRKSAVQAKGQRFTVGFDSFEKLIASFVVPLSEL